MVHVCESTKEYSQVSVCFQTRNTAVKPPLVDEHAFPPMGFAVAWFGYTLHWECSKDVNTRIRIVQNQNSLLVTRQMTLFHQGVRMGGKISPLNARVKRTWTHNHLTFQQ